MKAKLQSEQMSLPFIEREKPLILLSLQPQYWDMILEGAKKYEYRRLFRKDAVNAYIYVSTPRKEIVGFVEFAEPIIDSPENIASFAEKQRPGSQKPMLDYMKNCDVGYAIPILSYEAIKPLSLKILRDYFPNFTAPQNYIVLDNNPQLLDFIKSFRRNI